jgi:uncharacterized protein (DUF302 family)
VLRQGRAQLVRRGGETWPVYSAFRPSAARWSPTVNSVSPLGTKTRLPRVTVVMRTPLGSLAWRSVLWARQAGRPASAALQTGITTVECHLPVAETIELLTDAALAAGLLILARIDHAQGALDAGMALRPTVLLIFGNPKGGTPLMQDRQTTGIDLKVNALAWEDETTRNVEAIDTGLANLVAAVTG